MVDLLLARRKETLIYTIEQLGWGDVTEPGPDIRNYKVLALSTVL
jgi:hypothetical protein